MSRWQAVAVLVAVWAVIFLPALGTTEIKGEEGRRILPAIAMLESGDWIVPTLSGEPYLRKPPLMNWLIAGSIRLLDRRDEWAARLPSVLAVLALGLLTILACSRWLRAEGALVAAIFMVTHIGIIEKGRLAEIEALYIALTGMAMVAWLASWRLGGSPWMRWIVAWLFLALAILAKGPVHLLYFYALVLAVLWRARDWRELLRLPHLVGLLAGVGLVLLWLIPYLQQTAGGEAASTWRDQMANRIVENKLDVESWLLSVPRGLANLLPWVLLAPLLWHRDLRLPDRDLAILRGGRLVLVLGVALLLVPGFLVRYSMPLLPLACLLLGLCLRDDLPPRWKSAWKWSVVALAGLAGLAGLAAPLATRGTAASIAVACLAVLLAITLWRGRGALESPLRLATASGCTIGMIILIYAAAIVPRMVRADDVRPMAAAIDAEVPTGETLYAFKIDYQLAMFYVRSKVVHFKDLDELPPNARFLLARERTVKDVEEDFPGVTVVRTLKRNEDRKPLLILRLPPRRL